MSVLDDVAAISDPDKITDAQGAAVLAELEKFVAHTGRSHAELSQGTGLSSLSLAMFFGEKWCKDWRTVAASLAIYVNAMDAFDATAPVPTRIVREVVGLSKALIEDGGIGLIHGDSGVGKTTAIEAVMRRFPQSFALTAVTVRARPKPMLEDIRRAIGASVWGKATADVYENVRGALSRRKGNLMIVDEVHRYIGRDDCLHVLSDLLKQTHVPQLWSATGDLLRYIDKKLGTANDPFAQVRSRISHTLNLNDLRDEIGGVATTDEINELAGRLGVKLDTVATRELLTLANLSDEGGLRLVHNVVKHAKRFVTAGKLETATLAIIRRAMDRSIGERTLARLIRSTTLAKPAAAATSIEQKRATA